MIKNNRSAWRDVLSRITQGSALGPVLFVVYINQCQARSKSNLYLFADDTKLYREITSDKFVELLQEDPRKLEDWSKIFYCILMMINVYIC